MTLSCALVLALSGVIQHACPEGGPQGVVVAAPHDGFDDHTGVMARALGAKLGWGWVVATGYRSREAQRWFDVNRPTTRPWEDGRFGPREETDEARELYARYQARLQEAGGLAEGEPLELLVELHGNSRQLELKSGRALTRVIELATQGFDEETLSSLQARFRALVEEHIAPDDRVDLAVDVLDPEYDVGGVSIPFYFKATGAKKAGALSPARTKRALHFELPRCVRDDPEVRAAYVEVLALLLREL